MKSRFGFPGADDPAYAHEFELLASFCRSFLEQHEKDDYDGCMFDVGRLVASCAMIYKLSPPGGLIDPAEMFKREETGG